MSKVIHKRQVALKQGPYRPFVSSDIYNKVFAVNLKIPDFALAVLLAVSFILRQIRSGGLSQAPRRAELKITEAVNHYIDGDFYISSFPPPIMQLLAFSAKITGNLSIELLRKINLVVAAATVSAVYLMLRQSSITCAISVVAAAALSRLPLFVEESISFSAELPQLLFLTGSLLSWNIFKRCRFSTKGWYQSLFLLTLFITFSVGTKFLGIVTWAWFLLLLIRQAWNTIGDVNVKNWDVARSSSWKVATVGILPPITLLLSYFVFLSNSRGPSLDHSGLVSPYFENWFLPQPMPQPDVVYYGSKIVIRHAQSLGGYLHSHNYTYPGGSGEQQVSLFLHSNDGDNEWIVEPYSQDLEYEGKLEPVRNFALIKLRHKSTGKLLRASAAKPPISEQDHDHEVSCTGDVTYNGDSDESWRIRFERGMTVHDAFLCPYTVYFSLDNLGQSCKLLSHDLRLPDWGFGQQEVLCVDSADKERSLFFVDRSNLYRERGAYLPRPKDWIGKTLWKLTKEYVQRQYKYNYYLENKDLMSDIKMDNWLWSTADDTSTRFVWFTPLACLAIYLVVEMSGWVRWNPWAKPVSKIDPVKFLYLDNCGDLTVGWFMHYYIFTWCKHENLALAQYLPGYLLTLILAAYTANFFWQLSSASRFLLIGYAATVIIAAYMWP
ncbi:LAME_0G06700g1_1 [Lachancea meyersii CBS 8951]|uniref:dolichyl-phosphate-mannose--protein mannosyltransferase n=1 Tax=Lachancea meyersii CBS 8951 TaxID=1266667 RepID=A0A1G4K7R7_9SACH|nr:LAME_0G06700g1_1 [Lachancea meyersii CBS 8951]